MRSWPVPWITLSFDDKQAFGNPWVALLLADTYLQVRTVFTHGSLVLREDFFTHIEVESDK